ncbi:MAG: radical SAM family heme chaperone HemW [Candidatus Cryptobacteroides sp.]|uniref:radical SAM family heme chaperone HemW n=1 Tax=Candidatus Cryptobacteroides sp. TaxID=2952915 RepID=UPI002A840555|nr:radical SAM family heme chaperone HemW [Candidatus Cryptobacteroides sp.]MDY5043236.1 radical SAM family heme chaperone HemW [Candidatus Cryptobacteroides sp.]
MVYLHVPFCRSFCTYCGFYSETCSKSRQSELFNEYADAVLTEAEERKEEIRSNPLRTLYIGGGTPSVLPPDVLRRVVQGIRRVQGDTPLREFTIEVNPEDIVEKGDEYLAGLLDLGVTRISMGIQSFDDGILRWMNRRHDSTRARMAYSMIRRAAGHAGKDIEVSIDLIFGVPGLDLQTWERTISAALSLGKDEGFKAPDHISAYQLSIEEGSALEEKIARGECTEASDEDCYRQYRTLCRKLRQEGYNHYEISNFAIPGKEAVHNSAYWNRTPYVGLGPGAHSLTIRDDGQQVRSWNTQVLPARGKTYSREMEVLSDEDIRVERIMLGLRTSAGLPADELSLLAGKDALEKQVAAGCLAIGPDGRARIPEERFFVSDEIIGSLV